MLRGVKMMQEVEEMAINYKQAAKRYTDGLRPEDLIRLASFLREWIPPKQ